MARGTGMSRIPTDEIFLLSGFEENTTFEPSFPTTESVPRAGLLTNEYTALVPLTGAPQRARRTPCGNLTTVSEVPVKSLRVLTFLLKMNEAAV